MRPLVLVESPFAGNRETNAQYLRKAMRDCVLRGEAPFASHMLYTQFLDDDVPEERAAGIESGLAWGSHAEKTVVYRDLGISGGMQLGIDRALEEERPVEYRTLAGWQE